MHEKNMHKINSAKFLEHLWMTAPGDCLVSAKVLFSDYTFSFFPSFYPFITNNCNYGSLFNEGIRAKKWMNELIG